MKALICGGRHFNDYLGFTRAMTEAVRKFPILHIISGSPRVTREIGESYHGLRGVDDIALCWANRTRIKSENFPADWNGQGKAAGPIRNQRMLDEGQPDIVFAFPGGKGTTDMCLKASRAGVPVYVRQGDAWVEIIDNA